jgi:hypothetical protein
MGSSLARSASPAASGVALRLGQRVETRFLGGGRPAPGATVEQVRLDIAAPRRDPQRRRGGSMPAPDRVAGHDFHLLEPDVLDQDMTASDLVWALENLHFTRDRNAALN